MRDLGIAGQGSDSTDPYARTDQTFPVLSIDMASRLARFGARESVADGGFIFRRGERTVDFFLICAGKIAMSGRRSQKLVKAVGIFLNSRRL